MEGLIAKYPNSDRLEWNRDNDNFEVLHRSDILISDFSGVIFDFTLIYDKPCLYTDPKFDNGLYDAWWLEKPMWTLSALPRIGEQITVENINDLEALIEKCLNDPKFKDGRKEVKAETWANFGSGAVKATDYILKKYEQLTNSKAEDN